jgi:hypothetical protein
MPVFGQPWKNVAATIYHQLNEARTDPDVDDAIRTGDSTRLGFTSAVPFPGIASATQITLIPSTAPSYQRSRN